MHHDSIDEKMIKQVQHQTHLGIKYSLTKVLGYVLTIEVVMRDLSDANTLNLMANYDLDPSDVLTSMSIRQIIFLILNTIVVLIVMYFTFFYNDDLQVELLSQ